MKHHRKKQQNRQTLLASKVPDT